MNHITNFDPILTINTVLDVAKILPKSWESYSLCKRLVESINFTPQEYDDFIRKITEILEL